MVKIYLVRHCEAEGNKLKIFQGSTDCDVSELGIKQLEYLNRRFASVNIDKAYASPLKRAYKTALAAVYGKNIEVIPDDDFREMNGGIFEGKPFVETFAKYPEYGRLWVEELHAFAPPEGESIAQVYERAKKAFLKVANDPENDGKTILIASHGAFTKCLLCFLVFNDLSRVLDIPWPSNTSVSLIKYENGQTTVEYFNDDSHVPEECMAAGLRDVNNLWKNEE